MPPLPSPIATGEGLGMRALSVDTFSLAPLQCSRPKPTTFSCANGEQGRSSVWDAHVGSASAVLAAGKALVIVEVLLQAAEPFSAREIGDRRGVNRTTTHRLRNTLIHHGSVERDANGGYQFSVKFGCVAHRTRPGKALLAANPSSPSASPGPRPVLPATSASELRQD